MKTTGLFVGLLLVVAGLKAQDYRSVLNSTRKIADKIIRETSFDYTPTTIGYNGGWSQFTLPEMDGKIQYFAKSVLVSDTDLIGHLGICFRGKITISLNGEEIFSGESKFLEISEYTYNRYRIQEILPVSYRRGKNELLLTCMENGENGENGGTGTMLMLMPVNNLDAKELTVSFEQIIKDVSGSEWLISGPYPMGTELENLSKMSTLREASTSGSKASSTSSSTASSTSGSTSGSPTERFKGWTVPAQALLKELGIRESNSYLRDSYADWHYANGGTMLGVLNFHHLTGEEKYLDFVRKYASNIIINQDYFQWQYRHLHAMRGSFYRLFRLTMLDDSGGPALPFAELERIESSGDYNALLEEVLEYVSKGQQRLPDMTLSRPEPEPNTLWGDDLFMATPFLCRMAILTEDQALFDDVARQVVQFNKYLQDDQTGLYFHGWYVDRNESSSVRWGRANGWITWAMSEVLQLMPENHKQYKNVLKIFKNHIEAIAEYQDESGMWHQVLDHPETYEETSCTAMFTLALSRGVIHGWLKEEYRHQAIRGWKALETRIGEDGTVVGICRGTEIGETIEFYQARKTFDHDPRGLGAMLTAGTEVARLLQSSSEKGSE